MMKLNSLKEVNFMIFVNYNEDMDITWLDNTGILKVNNNVIAKISLVTSTTANIYDRYIVDIIDIRNGLIDTKLFDFKNYINNNDEYYFINQDGKFTYNLKDYNTINYDLLLQPIFTYISYFG